MKKKKTLPKKKVLNKKYAKGALGAGFAYAVLAMLIILAAGSAMIGNIAPSSKSPQNGQSVIVTTNTPQPSKSNLQLYTFPGVTFTPTPTPTPIPQPQISGGGGNGDSGGSGSGSCFPKGTKIAMADGTEKNIESVKAGDKVLGFNGQKAVEETVLETEAPIRDHLYKISFEDGSTLELTREHPLFTNNGWESVSPISTAKENPQLAVGTLHVGDGVLNIHNKFVKITAMTYIPGKVQTYNLRSVTGFDDYYANDYAAHNKGSCFVAGTKILLANGLQKDIENVSVGDKVMGYDVFNKKLAPETVLKVESPIRDHIYKLTFGDNNTVELTKEHPLYTLNGWESISPESTKEENPNLAVGVLKVGDQVLEANGQYGTIISMEYIPGTIQTYNLKSVTGYNDFFANGILAHNKGGGGGGGGGGGSGGGSAR
jgi:uncharacterized membrane protein YgcG